MDRYIMRFIDGPEKDESGAWCKYSDVADLESQLQAVQAELSTLRGCANLLEETLRQKALLVEEVAALRADNAAMINNFRQIHRHIHPHNVPWYSPEIDHICDSVREDPHPGDSLLKELEQLRAVKAAAETTQGIICNTSKHKQECTSKDGEFCRNHCGFSITRQALAAANGGD